MKTVADRLILACALLAAGIAPSAGAKATSKPDTVAKRPVASICLRNLASVQCGRHQTRVLLAKAERMGRSTDAAAIRALGRQQIDALIDSVS